MPAEPEPQYVAVSHEPGVWQVHDTHRQRTLPGRYDQASAEHSADALNTTPIDDTTESESAR
jgi:hypothetical protein